MDLVNMSEIWTTNKSCVVEIAYIFYLYHVLQACDIKDPKQNIEWTVPEGGGGPKYSVM